MKTLLKVCFSLASILVLSSPGSAAEAARYRIDLQDGSRVYARDMPVRRGTVFTFHQHPGGVLTGVPAELVLRIEPGSGAQAAAPRVRPKLQGGVSSGLRPGEIFVVGPAEGLKPGEVLVLGPTGEGGANVPQPNVAPGTSGAMSMNSGVAPATGSPTTIGPDGFPVLSPGVPGSSTPAATTVPVPEIGPNGTPVLAQPGAPQPIIGPNGTPVLAPPGAPGSAAPNTAPNGTPAAPPAGSGAPPSS